MSINLNTSHDFAAKKELSEVKDQLNKRIDLMKEEIKLIDSKVTFSRERMGWMESRIVEKLILRLGGFMVAYVSIGLLTLGFFTRSIS
jgi:hypothetical protein